MASVKIESKLTPEDCAHLRHGIEHIRAAIDLCQRCRKGDPEVQPLIDEYQKQLHTMLHYLCEFGDGDPSEMP